MNSIDLNADLGEGGPQDKELMAMISSANIACGGHVGSWATMRRALDLAKAHGVAVGAHPSYPDKENFGRVSMELSRKELWEAVFPQIEWLCLLAWEEQMTLRHVKPHGALYHDAARDRVVADVIVEAAVLVLSGQIDPRFAIVGPPHGELRAAAAARGVAYRAEGFADRAYTAEGMLVPRSAPGAVIEEAATRCGQALTLAKDGLVTTITGQVIPLQVQTICLHGDTSGAAASAKAIRLTLEAEGVTVKAPYD